MRTLPAIITTAALALAITACGGGDDDSAADGGSDTAGETGDAADELAADDSEADDSPAPATPADEPAADAPAGNGGGAGAILTLANGETFEFSILCSLEPQTSAGSEILFTATSYDTPSLDITQFGNDGTVTDIASISVYDADYETLWEASTFYDAVGGTIELSLDGSTIRGSGSFFPGGDMAQTPVDGDVVAEC